MPLPSRERVKLILLIAFLGGGLLLVRAGALSFWLWCLLTAGAVLLRVAGRLDTYTDQLSVDADGITRRHGSRLRRESIEAVRWDELKRVEVLAREMGPDRQEPLFLLHGAGTAGVAVSGALAQRHALADTLRQRLPGWRDDRLAEALAATESGAFTLWEKDAG